MDYDYNDSDHAHAVTDLDDTHKYWYDANGSMITRTVGTDTFYLEYDAENRLTGVSGLPSPTQTRPLPIQERAGRLLRPECL